MTSPEQPTPPPRPATPPEVNTIPPARAQIGLDDLIRAAEPLATAYFETQTKEHERDINFRKDVLKEEGRRHKNMVVGTVVLGLGLMGVAAVLMWKGKDDSAVTLIQLIVSLGAAAFGGYGVAKGRMADEKDAE